ncbi:vitamin B12 dependent-methionine synthase activation domain-containing protein [Anaerostipes sp.]|uniref:vitamin B12 dependent-methionine synthase activation domain-containing protein n=1 Tax=Anaerostipes sp. TaxID=1872530 RepID=UPI0025C3F668|nr:vitamin B12 dependent-methionine synthase activation domain-containing protein [Anaerostipes sp.]MBS7007006.1 Vitamin B12 dependent methionine synthase, activation domain protein [Anaerostipes sp.]
MIKETALKYLGHTGQEITEELHILLEDCIQEVKQVSQPKAVTRRFELDEHPLRIKELDLFLPGEQIKDAFSQCSHCLLIGVTLGVMLERRIKYYEKSNMTRAAVMDAVSSAYLEEYCDEYEEGLGYPNRTYRLCPGYGDIPLSFNREIARVLDIGKNLGITLTPDNLMIPQKSMLGVIGIGAPERKKQCGQCVMKEDCPFRKRGQRCY